MGIVKLISYAAIPAAVGALVSLGYDDISAVEGMRQAVIAGLPAAAFMSPSGNVDETLDFAADHPYAIPALGAGLLAGLYALGGLGMEYLTQNEISQGFTSAVGGLEGALFGILASTIGRLKR